MNDLLTRAEALLDQAERALAPMLKDVADNPRSIGGLAGMQPNAWAARCHMVEAVQRVAVGQIGLAMAIATLKQYAAATALAEEEKL